MQMSRRHFVKSALALPLILSGRAHGKPSPNNLVNLALIGAGARGNQVLSNFTQVKEAKVIAICDCFEARRLSTQKTLNDFYQGQFADTYSDFRDVLAREDIDGVIVATPDHWHVPIALAAARCGKDMYVEKPLGVSMAWAWKLRHALRESGSVFQYGTQQRSAPQFRRACELVRNGYIGEVSRVDAWCPDMSSQYTAFQVPQFGSTEPAPVPEGFDYETWLGPAPEKPYTVDRCTNFGAYHGYDYALGFIAGWGAHPLDIVQWGLGLDHTSPIHYTGTGSVPTQGLYGTVDSWDMHCTYENGVDIHFMGHRVAEPIVTAYRPWKDHGTTFFGTEGWISVDRSAIHASDPKLLEIALKPDDIHFKASQSHGHDFVESMKSRASTLSHFECALHSDTISHLSDIAIRLNRPITWDPKREHIVDDVEAQGRLERPVRKPWNLAKRMLR